MTIYNPWLESIQCSVLEGWIEVPSRFPPPVLPGVVSAHFIRFALLSPDLCCLNNCIWLRSWTCRAINCRPGQGNLGGLPQSPEAREGGGVPGTSIHTAWRHSIKEITWIPTSNWAGGPRQCGRLGFFLLFRLQGPVYPPLGDKSKREYFLTYWTEGAAGSFKGFSQTVK